MNIQNTIKHLGGVTGAIAYTGTSRISYDEVAHKLVLRVNGPKIYQTYISIEDTGDDTFTIRLIQRRAFLLDISNTTEGIDAEDLQFCVEQLYDEQVALTLNGLVRGAA